MNIIQKRLMLAETHTRATYMSIDDLIVDLNNLKTAAETLNNMDTLPFVVPDGTYDQLKEQDAAAVADWYKQHKYSLQLIGSKNTNGYNGSAVFYNYTDGCFCADSTGNLSAYIPNIDINHDKPLSQALSAKVIGRVVCSSHPYNENNDALAFVEESELHKPTIPDAVAALDRIITYTTRVQNIKNNTLTDPKILQLPQYERDSIIDLIAKTEKKALDILQHELYAKIAGDKFSGTNLGVKFTRITTNLGTTISNQIHKIIKTARSYIKGKLREYNLIP